MTESNLNKKTNSNTDSHSSPSFQLKKTLVERLLNFGFLKNEAINFHYTGIEPQKELYSVAENHYSTESQARDR